MIRITPLWLLALLWVVIVGLVLCAFTLIIDGARRDREWEAAARHERQMRALRPRRQAHR